MTIELGVFNMFASPTLMIVEIADDTDIFAYFQDVADDHEYQIFSDEDLLLISKHGEIQNISTGDIIPVLIIRRLGYTLTPLDEYLCRVAVDTYLKTLK